MAEVAAIPCPLCANTSRFLDVRVPTRDDHIRSYGALYEGLDKSQWKICGRCAFAIRTRGRSAEALDRFYLAGDYHTKIDIAAGAGCLPSTRRLPRTRSTTRLSRSGLANGTVFDVGCGLGSRSSVRGARWTCTASSRIAAASIRARALRAADDQARHVDAKLEHPGQVRPVCTRHTRFEHFADSVAVMTAMARILKPGGYKFTAIPSFRENRARCRSCG